MDECMQCGAVLTDENMAQGARFCDACYGVCQRGSSMLDHSGTKEAQEWGDICDKLMQAQLAPAPKCAVCGTPTPVGSMMLGQCENCWDDLLHGWPAGSWQRRPGL